MKDPLASYKVIKDRSGLVDGRYYLICNTYFDKPYWSLWVWEDDTLSDGDGHKLSGYQPDEFDIIYELP